MKKILLVALMALCGASFGFGKPTMNEVEELEKKEGTEQCIKEKTLECINMTSGSASSLDDFVSITQGCYKKAEKIDCAN